MAAASNSAAAWFLKALEGEAGKVAMAQEGDRHKALAGRRQDPRGIPVPWVSERDRRGGGFGPRGPVRDCPTRRSARRSETDSPTAVRSRCPGPKSWTGRMPRTACRVRPPEPAPWPPLRLEEKPPAPSFPVEAFPPPLRRYCREVAAAIQVPVEFVGAAMLAVAGAAVGQAVNLVLSRTWTEPPLLYLILVGRPGTAKSPTVREVCRPLSAIDRRLRRESIAAREEWLEAKKAHEKDPDERPPGPEPPQLRAIVKDITRAARWSSSWRTTLGESSATRTRRRAGSRRSTSTSPRAAPTASSSCRSGVPRPSRSTARGAARTTSSPTRSSG